MSRKRRELTYAEQRYFETLDGVIDRLQTLATDLKRKRSFIAPADKVAPEKAKGFYMQNASAVNHEIIWAVANAGPDRLINAANEAERSLIDPIGA